LRALLVIVRSMRADRKKMLPVRQIGTVHFLGNVIK